jgi:hypothetical protein
MVSLSKDNGTFVDEGLRAFQGLTDIEVAFSSHGPHAFGFKVGDYDESKELIIDPLVYSTFIGGSDFEVGESIAIDSAGNALVTGLTHSPDFPMVNAYDKELSRNGDCFVFKVSADGSTLLYSTFIGGVGPDLANSIAVDSSGNAFVTGNTDSFNFPTVNAYDNTLSGNDDCFVFKLSADGSTLLYSTFIGGRERDSAESIAVDSSGNAFVTGWTHSPDFPTANAYSITKGGDEDCFVLKLSADGLTLLYSTYVGGDDYDEASSIAVDSYGNAYVAGITSSSDFPTVNAYDNTLNGNNDCFMLKLSANGSTLLYSTFIGGVGSDLANSIAVDSSGNAFVTGETDSFDFPLVNAYDNTVSGDDCFVFKLSANGSTLLYSTFVGGTGNDWATSIAIDGFGNAFVTGYTSSPDFPTVNAFNGTFSGGEYWLGISDCFVFKLSFNGSTLLYSTFVGGEDSDGASSLAVDLSGNVYVTGYTESSDFPTANAYNSTYGGNGDFFVLKLSISGDPDFLILYNALRTGILQFLRYIFLVYLGVLTLIVWGFEYLLSLVAWGFAFLLTLVAWGFALLTQIHLMRILVSRPATDIVGTPSIGHTRLICSHCSATYFYGPQHEIGTGVVRCQNCNREFQSGTTFRTEETVPIQIIHVPVAYTLLSRLRESWWNIFRSKRESE